MTTDSREGTTKSLVVQHTLVGVHRAGDIIHFVEEDAKKAGIDVERLLRIGAVREATPEEARTSVVYGTSEDAMPPVFPAVPFEATAPGSPDPLRSENPPTVPASGMPMETTPIGGDVSQEPEAPSDAPAAVKRAVARRTEA